MAENETLTQGKGERTGIFTTGIVARGLDATLAPIILYASGRRHAGENMDRLLNQRTVQESDVIHMADASSMAPRSPRRITAKCMVHARRYFFEAEPAFPEHCERVLEDIATIYRNDDETRDMTPDARLAYHQQHSRPVMDALAPSAGERAGSCSGAAFQRAEHETTHGFDQLILTLAARRHDREAPRCALHRQTASARSMLNLAERRCHHAAP